MYGPSFEIFEKLAQEGNLIPLYREVLADLETPVTALMKLAEKPHVFLLESVEGGEKWGRYTFLGAGAHALLRVEGECVEIHRNGSVERLSHFGDPLGALRDLMKIFRPVHVRGLPRFYGGAVGFLGYGMVRFFESIPEAAEDDLGIEEAAFLITDTLVIFDNTRHTMKLVACAFTEGREDDLANLYDETLSRLEALGAELGKPLGKSKSPAGSADVPRFEPDMTEGTFKGMVRRAKEYILAGDIIQVVLSQRFSTENRVHPVDLYRALRYINPSPYLFFLKLDGVTLIGSSPEVMVRQEEGVVELRPIAGTRPRGANEQEDRRLSDELLEDPKERAEHVMLVDLGRNDLGRIAKTGSVQVTQFMAVERYSHVMHLVSNIQAMLSEGKDSIDVLRATFPAGTLTGAPKIRAMEIIDELESKKRGPYGGAVGYFSFSGNMDFGITIRTMLLKNGRIYIQTGAGVVADSDPEAEYRETLQKAEGIMKAVRMASSGFEIGNDRKEAGQ